MEHQRAPRPLEFILLYGHREQGLTWRVRSYPTLKFSADHKMYYEGWDKPTVSLVSVRYDCEKHRTDDVDVSCLYLHLEDEPDRDPTDGEREWIGKMYLARTNEEKWTLLGCGGKYHGKDWLRRMLPRAPSLGASPMAWAFKGWDAQQVSKIYGDGSQVYVTAPCGPNQEILDGPHLESDESQRRERFLEEAVESGQIAGAMPADL